MRHPFRCRALAAVLAGVLLQLGGGSASGGATPQGLPPAELMARVQAQYDRTTHLHARFQQETRLPGFAQGQSGEGEVWILKPGMMRWDYTKPERQVIIANGETLWIYLPEERQVIRDRVQTSLGTRTPALFLAGQARLSELFAVAEAASQAPGEAELLRLELTPQAGTLPYARVELGVHPTSYQVMRVTLVDPVGNVTTLRFSDIDTASAVDPALFQFQVPPGVDVVAPPGLPVPR
jgi:outer membrane lipoprotein carrier protein